MPVLLFSKEKTLTSDERTLHLLKDLYISMKSRYEKHPTLFSQREKKLLKDINHLLKDNYLI